MKTRWIVMAAAVALGVSLWAQTGTTVQPIPAGFDFPADQQALLALRDSNNVAGMRRHSWMVFAGMTSPTQSGEAVWETWNSKDETFAVAPQPPAAAPRRAQRVFQAPRQFQVPGGAPPPAVGQSLASFTLFNGDLKDFVQTNKLEQKSTLRAINNGFGPQTPVADRKVPEFTRTSVALKTVWWIVKKSGMTALPVWDPNLNPPIVTGNRFNTWKRCVAIDPSRPTIPAGETTTLACNGQAGNGTRVVALESFYRFPLTQVQINQMRSSASDIPNLSTATPGDFVALVAMHVTTKEIPDWVWATFWWHDQPNDGPFAANRPDEVKGVWRNYLMAESYSMDTPKQPDSSAHVAFNPWLEAPFANGTVSNCMTCHRRAVFSDQQSDFAFLPVTRGTPPANDPRFKTATTTDFLWSVLIESR